MNTVEPFLRRNHITAVSREKIMQERREANVLEWLFWFCIFASIVYFLVPTVHAETIHDKSVYNAPDRIQEKTYCEWIQQGMKVNATPKEITKFCDSL